MRKIILFMFLIAPVLFHAQEKEIITSDGVKLYVKVKGKGTPALYLHGGPGSGSFWFEEFFGDFMEEHFTVIYLDQRGVGRSGSPADKNFSLDRMIKDFEEIREQLGYEQWLTLGHSFGGILQTAYALQKPEAVKGMIMVNTTLNLRESFCESWSPKAAEILGNKNHLGCAEDTIPLMERMQIHITRLKDKGLFWKMAYEEKINDSIMNATYAGFKNWNYDFGSTAMGIDDYWKNFKPLTSKVKVPVLFFYGTKDWMVGPKHYRGVNFPEMMLWKNDGGHIPFQENKEDLQEAILTFAEEYGF